MVAVSCLENALAVVSFTLGLGTNLNGLSGYNEMGVLGAIYGDKSHSC